MQILQPPYDKVQHGETATIVTELNKTSETLASSTIQIQHGDTTIANDI
jgi:hypothetical protein